MKESLLPCLVPSFCLTDMKVEMNSSFLDETKHEKVSDVVMKSCSAPTFFSAWKGSVDGGMFAHCPADLAIVYAMRELKVPLKDIYVLSFSTGHIQTDATKIQDTNASDNTHNFGYYQWASLLPTVIWEGMIEKSVLLCQQLIGDRFFRLDPILPKEYPLDNPQVLPELHALAKEVDLSRVCQWLQTIVSK